MFRTLRCTALAAGVTAALLLTGCTDPTTTPQNPNIGGDEPSTATPGSGGEGCFVHLFDGDDLNDEGSSFELTQPGKFATMTDLPAARDDWSGEADSLAVGPDATVTVWPEKNFGGQSQKFEAGTEVPHLDPEPMSLELVCAG